MTKQQNDSTPATNTKKKMSLLQKLECFTLIVLFVFNVYVFYLAFISGT